MDTKLYNSVLRYNNFMVKRIQFLEKMVSLSLELNSAVDVFLHQYAKREEELKKLVVSEHAKNNGEEVFTIVVQNTDLPSVAMANYINSINKKLVKTWDMYINSDSQRKAFSDSMVDFLSKNVDKLDPLGKLTFATYYVNVLDRQEDTYIEVLGNLEIYACTCKIEKCKIIKS